MKKWKSVKIAALVFACVMLLGALALAAFAANDEKVEIVANNVYYGDTFHIMYAINAPEGATLTATDTKGNEINVLYYGTAKVNGVTYPAYILETGMAAQSINEVVTFTVEYNGKVAVKNYSVLQYIYVRTGSLNKKVDNGTATAKDLAEIDMLQGLLDYAVLSNKFFCIKNGYTFVPFDSYQYVEVNGVTVNGANPTGMYAPGATPFANLDAIEYDAEKLELAFDVNGVRMTLDELKALTVADEKISVSVEFTDKACAHTYDEKVTDPTCTEGGYTTFTCSKCGDTYTGNATEAKGHSYKEVVTDPTCTEGGYTTFTCEECGDTYTGNATEATGHDYDEEVTGPTCTADGYTTKTCATCGDVQTIKGEAATGHSYKEVVTDPTCTEGGYTTFTCEECGDTYTGNATEAKGHNYVNGACGACGELDPDYYFEVTIDEIFASVLGAKVTFTGTVTSISDAWNDEYGNMSVYVTDESGSILCYRMKKQVVKGDIITVKGEIGEYGGAIQIINATAEIIGHDESYDEVEIPEVNIEEALELPEGTDVIVTGTVIRIDDAWDSYYGNMNVTIKDETGKELYVYRLATQVNVKDIITVTGQMGSYNGSKQIAAGATAEVVGTHECVEFTEATCKEYAKCVFCEIETGELADHKYVDGVCTVCGLATGVSTSKNTYNFSDYAVGTQYAEETHKLDDVTEMYIIKCHLNGELRIYSSGTNNGIAIFKSTSSITAISVNAGNKIDTLVVYGSNDDGATWTDVTEISVTATTYNDYTAELGGSYKWIKLDVKGDQQIRLKSISLTTIDCAHGATETVTTEADCVTAGYEIVKCASCGAVISKTEIDAATGHSYGEPEVTTEASCTDDGVKTSVCGNCGDKKEEVIEATGHTTEQGVCGNCGQEIGSSSNEPVEISVSKTHVEMTQLAGVSTSSTGGSLNNKEAALDENITITFSQGKASNPPAYYTESIRLYQNGAKFTVKAAEGCTIKTIVITLANGNTAGDGPISVTGGTASALENYVYTITANDGATEIVVTTTGTDKNSRLYVAGIEVVYEK